jgi:hypothetical protein
VCVHSSADECQACVFCLSVALLEGAAEGDFEEGLYFRVDGCAACAEDADPSSEAFLHFGEDELVVEAVGVLSGLFGGLHLGVYCAVDQALLYAGLAGELLLEGVVDPVVEARD